MDDEGWRYEACGYEGYRREGMKDDFKLFGGNAHRQTDKQTFVIV